MATLTPTQQEAARRIQDALDSIESAQWKISDSIQAISRISGPTVPKEYDRLCKLFDQIRSHWYSLESKLAGEKFDLDSDAKSDFLAKASQAPTGLHETHWETKR